MARIKLTHTHQTQIGQIWLAIGVAPREVSQLLNVLREIERDLQKFILYQRDDIGSRPQMKCRFTKYRLAGKQRFGDVLGQIYSPFVISVILTASSYDEAC